MSTRLQIPSPFPFNPGVIHVHEPADTDVCKLMVSLLRGTYPKPFVIEDARVRRLHFTREYSQSEMLLLAPTALCLAYTRKMAGFSLFAPAPRHVVIAGLGGGSLTKYCYDQLPSTRITTVEIDRDVIAFGDLFKVPPQDARNTLVQADAVDYIANMTDRADVILLDGCDRDGIAPAFVDDRFYADAYNRLEPMGILVMNLVGAESVRRASLWGIAGVFGDRMLVQDVSDGNQVVFAFKDRTFEPNWRAIESEARWRPRQYRLDFLSLARKFRATYQIRTDAPWRGFQD